MPIYALDGAKPEIADDCWIAPDANLIGKVTVGAGATIWFGSTLRGDNERITLGPGSNIQEDCVLHTDMGFPLTIGENATIGHKAMLHGCTIGDGALIGMGAIVLNGAVIGKGALIGAGALVTAGKQIPDGALVMGAPGKVVNHLDDAAQRNLELTARHYVENGRRYRDGLKKVDA